MSRRESSERFSYFLGWNIWDCRFAIADFGAYQARSLVLNSSGAVLMAPQWSALGTFHKITLGLRAAIRSLCRTGMLRSSFP